MNVSLGKTPRGRNAESKAHGFADVINTAKLPSIAICNSTNNVWEDLFPHSFSNSILLTPMIFCQSDRCTLLPCYSLSLCFSYCEWGWASFHVCSYLSPLVHFECLCRWIFLIQEWQNITYYHSVSCVHADISRWWYNFPHLQPEPRWASQHKTPVTTVSPLEFMCRPRSIWHLSSTCYFLSHTHILRCDLLSHGGSWVGPRAVSSVYPTAPYKYLTFF